LRHESLEYTIYLKLNEDKIIKIADAGHQLDDERIRSFLDKGIQYLYLTREDAKKHTSRYIKIAEALGGQKGVPIEKKQNYMLHIGDVIMNKVYSEEINEESFYDAKNFLDSTLEVLCDNTTTLVLFFF